MPMNEYSDPRPMRRRQTILGLIRSGPVRSQTQLQRLLRRRGLRVAQPTLSRDLRDLGLAKTPRGYVAPEGAGTRFVPAPRREARLGRALRGFVLSVRAAGTVVVLRTPAAAALPEAVGALAGDDTVFIATTSERAARALARRLTAALSRPALRKGA